LKVMVVQEQETLLVGGFLQNQQAKLEL